MEFEYLSAEKYEALSEYQKEKYLDQKREHEAKVAKEAAEKAAKEAVEASMQSKEDREKEVKDAVDAAISVVTDEYDKKIEKATAELNRVKENQGKKERELLSNQIENYIGGEEGKKMFEAAKADKSKFNFEIKAPGSMIVTPGSTRDEWVGNVYMPHEAVNARNIIPVLPTALTAIKYNQFSLGTDGNLINSVAAGEEKPQFEYIVTPKTAPVVKIAGWLQMHDEWLDDIDGARSFLAAELPQAYMDVETAKMLRTGTGGEDIDSIWNQASALPATVGSVTSSSNIWDKVAASLTQARINKRVPNAVWTSPETYLDLLINKDNENAYTYPVVMDTNGILRIAGVPIFQHTVFDYGEVLTGDYARGAKIFQREAINIRYSREHDKNFTHNETTVLIEARVALPVYFPDGFVKIGA